MGNTYLWVKAVHVVFVISWFGGLLYLPRIYANLAQADDAATRARLLLMARKLLVFMSWLGLLALVFGTWLMSFGVGAGAGWLQAKLGLVALLIGYHAWCGVLYARLASGASPHSDTWYRWFNEIPFLLAVGIVVLVVVKPF